MDNVENSELSMGNAYVQSELQQADGFRFKFSSNKNLYRKETDPPNVVYVSFQSCTAPISLTVMFTCPSKKKRENRLNKEFIANNDLTQ